MGSENTELMLKSLGELINKLRKEKGFTQESLGKATETSQMTIKRLESATVGTRIDNLFAVTKALDVRLSDVFASIEGGKASKVEHQTQWGEVQALVDGLSSTEREWVAEVIKSVLDSPWKQK